MFYPGEQVSYTCNKVMMMLMMMALFTKVFSFTCTRSNFDFSSSRVSSCQPPNKEAAELAALMDAGRAISLFVVSDVNQKPFINH